MLDSPYVRRVAVAMLTAGVPFVHRPISLFRHIPEFSKINPLLRRRRWSPTTARC